MIKVFGEGDTTFTTNGDMVIEPLKARVKKIDNGDFLLDIEAPIKYLEWFVPGKIIVANTPQGEQAFRIRNTAKTDYKITASCWHISYDLFYNYYVYSLPYYDLFETITHLLSRLTACITPTPSNFPFTFSTNAPHTIDYEGAWEYSNKSVFEIFADVVSRVDLHMVRDNFSFALNTSIGADRGVNIRYGTNLKDMTKTEKWDNVCTVCYPIGKEGIHMDGIDYVQSQIQYAQKYSKQVNFAQTNVRREWYNTAALYKAALQADLYAAALRYVNSACYPEITYDFKAHLDGVLEIGDTVKVIDENIGVDMLTTVKSFEYDCLTGMYTDVTFGNVAPTAKGLGKSVIDIFSNQIGGIIQDKQLDFADDGSVKWVTRNN